MSTVAPVDVAHTYGSPPYVDIAARYAQRGIRVRGVENPQGFGIDERRFIAWDSAFKWLNSYSKKKRGMENKWLSALQSRPYRT